MRVLGVDSGTKWIGLAVSDELAVSIRPLQVLKATTVKQDARRITQIARDVQAETIVVGLPVHMDGSWGSSAARAMKLVAQLRKLTGKPVVAWDERLSSCAAMELLQQRGEKPTKIRTNQIAACLILQDYLSAQSQQITSLQTT